ncbi:MAG: hypothetical protein LBQ66_00805 [Planctomycetaceae bacterium]|nr:hypothetical protein [Planctomycetaceae bacterium]
MLWQGVCLFFVEASEAAVNVGSVRDAELVGEKFRRSWSTNTVPLSFLAESSIRQLKGKHSTIYTDVGSSVAVDSLPMFFDLMVVELCRYFGVDYSRYEKFYVQVFLIDDLEKFNKHGLLENAKDIRNGYSFQNRIWVRHNASDYYQRHLLLHEEVHAFIVYAFGVTGAYWFREGIAEMLATHKYENGKLTSCWYPSDNLSVPHFGRIEVIQRLIATNKISATKNEIAQNDSVEKKYTSKNTNTKLINLNLLSRFGGDGIGLSELEVYSLCWGFAMFCENHERYHKAYRQIVTKLENSGDEVMQRFVMLIARDQKMSLTEARRQLEYDWYDFQMNICYGYDFERTVIDYNLPTKKNAITTNTIAADAITTNTNSTKNAGTATSNSAQNVGEPLGIATIQSNRGWQNSGVILERGKLYEITSAGRFQVAQKPAIWWAEPNGITIKYNQGVPLGKLLGTIIPEQIKNNSTAKNTAQNTANDEEPPQNFETIPEYKTIGLNTTWQPTVTGYLYLRINDSPATLKDNKGTIEVKIFDRVQK